MGLPPYQHVECFDCGFENIGPTAMMLGKKHAKDHGHTVHWTQQHTGFWEG